LSLQFQAKKELPQKIGGVKPGFQQRKAPFAAAKLQGNPRKASARAQVQDYVFILRAKNEEARKRVQEVLDGDFLFGAQGSEVMPAVPGPKELHISAELFQNLI
jgi:hypothetical protein